MASQERGNLHDSDPTLNKEVLGPSNLIYEIVQYLELFDGESKPTVSEPDDEHGVKPTTVAREALEKVLIEVKQRGDILDEYRGSRSRRTDFGVLASVRGDDGVAAVITAVTTGEDVIRLPTPDNLDEATSVLHPTVEPGVYAWDRTYKSGESEDRTVDLVVASRKAIRANRKEKRENNRKTLFTRLKRIPALPRK